MVTYEQGAAMAKELGLQYVETSALTMHGLKECFDTAVSFAVVSLRVVHNKCMGKHV